MNKFQEAVDQKTVSKASMKQAHKNIEWRKKKMEQMKKMESHHR